MNERLLQYIWQMQYFNEAELQTEDGQTLRVAYPGILNRDQGPDFLHARVVLNGVMMQGSIELHLWPQDWIRHRHGDDPRYDDVILHVVWQEGPHQSSSKRPLLVLEPRTPKLLLERYDKLSASQSFVPCSGLATRVPALSWIHWLERLMIERLMARRDTLLREWELVDRHWEELCWRRLARNFGYRVNAEAFHAVAETIPVLLLAKLRDHEEGLEAVLLGQAGLLRDLEQSRQDCHVRSLQREYEFLRAKHHLETPAVTLHFLRMRPSNFADLRLAQLAGLIHRRGLLFDILVNTSRLQDVLQLLQVDVSPYWNAHYRLGEQGRIGLRRMGKAMRENIVINTFVPMLFTYAEVRGDERVRNRVVSWLLELRPERNHITDGWKRSGIAALNALETQALLQLYQYYCNPKKCLDCAVGHSLLRRREK